MKKIYLLIFCTFLFVAVENVKAQEEIVVEETGEALEIEIIADTNIRNLVFAPLDEKNYGVGFDIVNEWHQTQPGIRYALELFAAGERGGYLVDKVVFDEDLSLSPGGSAHRELTYQVPESLPAGTYVLQGKLTSKKGLDLALVEIGTIEKEGQSGLHVDPGTCYLKIGEEKFGLMEGVDLSVEEQLNVVCEDVKNLSNENQRALVHMMTWERVATGDLVEQKDIAYEDFVSGENKQVSYVVEKPFRPQAYEGRILFYINDGSEVSNGVNFRYVVQGDSATIQNATTDKNYYANGDNAKVSIMMSGVASAFPGARNQQLLDNLANPENLILKVSVVDAEQNACANEISEELDGFAENVELNALIKKECKDPTVIAKIEKTDGALMDQADFMVKTEEKTSSTLIPAEKKDVIKIIAIAIAVIPLIILVAYFISRKKRANISIFFLMAIFCSSIFLVNLNSAEASSFSTKNYHCFTLDGEKGYCTVSGTYDIVGGTTQKDCENVWASASMKWSGCSNITARAKLYINGSNVWSNNSNPDDYAKTIWVTKNSGLKTKNLGKKSVGSHRVNYKMTFYHDWHDWNFNRQTEEITASKRYNVVSCAVDGACGTRHGKTGNWTTADLGKYTLCKKGSFEWVSGLDDPTVGRWEWKCKGSGGGKDSGICWAKPPTINGACSTGKIASPIPASQAGWKSTAATQFCAKGTPSPNPPLFPSYGKSVSWKCLGSGPNHTDASGCTATRATEKAVCSTGKIASPIPVNQADWKSKAKTQFCAVGTPSPTIPTFPSYGETVRWTCLGLGPNMDVSCSANRDIPKAACGANANGVETGVKPSNPGLCPTEHVASEVVQNGGVWEWTCTHNYPTAVGNPKTCTVPLPEPTCASVPITNTTPTGGLCGVGSTPTGTPVFVSDGGLWRWVCKHNETAFPPEIQCNAKSCLSDLPINAPSHVYFGPGGSVKNAKVTVRCPIPGSEICCEIDGNVDDGDDTDQDNFVCTGDSGEIEVPAGGSSYNARCWIDDDDDDKESNYTFSIGTMCTSRSCNSQGTCQTTPQVGANADSCKSTCNSNADCSRGRMIETRP